jgi:hypothetical protein
MRIAIVFLAATVACGWAQDTKMPVPLEKLVLDKLAEKAVECVDVTLDGNLLQLAGRFLNDKDADEAKAKKLITGLKSIMVRSFTFAKDGEYNLADYQDLRNHLQPPAAWSRIVGVTSKTGGDNVDVYLKVGDGSQIGGLVVIAAEPKELTIVSIVGSIRPEDIVELGGQFGIPKLNVQQKKVETQKKSEPQKKGKEDE